MFEKLIIFFLITLFFTRNLIILLKKKNFFIDQPNFSFHKKFIINNNNNVPLCGGFILLIATFFFFDNNITSLQLKLFSFFIFFLGFLSDINKINKPTLRLIIQIFLVLLFVIILDIKILDLRSEFLNRILALHVASYFFVTFCILIVINGGNFIDGINLNLISYYLAVILILIYLSVFKNLELNENIYILFIISIVLAFYNYTAKLFMGDSGAYLLSFLSSFYLIDFYGLNKFISPYFICLLLWYPAFETFFSIVRRLKKKNLVSNPDVLHLHQLIYLFISKKFKKKVNSSQISILINTYNLIIFFICSYYIDLTKFQLVFIFLNIAIYLAIYIKLFNIMNNYTKF